MKKFFKCSIKKNIIIAYSTCFLMACSHGETILQYFGTSWSEINNRIPELSEAGWTALWLPPPFKAGSQYSVGFDTFDRFDLGKKNQMGGVSTLYGTESELLELISTAHRFGLRVYFDNVMAHNGGPIPAYNDAVSVYAQPGFVPEDFHLIRTPGGFFRKPPTTDYSVEWQVLNRNDFGLDIAHEDPNTSFGDYEDADFPKYRGIRHPKNPEYYLDTDIQIGVNGDNEPIYTFANKESYEDVGYGTNNVGANNNKFDWSDDNNNGQHDENEISEPFLDTGLDVNRPNWQTPYYGFGDNIYNMGNPNAEDVNTLLFRAVRWFVDKSYADGFRLDAVKHVPYYFFGKTYDPKDSSNWGYNGQIQEQFNITRGFSDWNNHRDSVFNVNQGRDDAMLFGEHLGNPPPQEDYVKAGMRMADNSFMNSVNYAVATTGSLTGQDQPGYSTYGINEAVLFTGSHDYNTMSSSNRPPAHALLFTREGLPILYTDGYNETLYPDAAGKFFPQHGNNAFLGQFNDKHILDLLRINQLFARGQQVGRWSDNDFVAYERQDWREASSASGATTLAFMLARNGTSMQARNWSTDFPEGARLKNYSGLSTNNYVNVVNGELKTDQGINPSIDGGEYLAYSWRVPEAPLQTINENVNTRPIIQILQDGQLAPTMLSTRQDGRSGDPNFNPYDLPNDTTNDYKYSITIPRITAGTNISFIALSDGSSENTLIKLDGGIDVNSHLGIGPQTNDLRDYPPAISYDLFLGYEQMQLDYRVTEIFASTNNFSLGCINSDIYSIVIDENETVSQSLLINNKYENDVSKINSITHQFSDVLLSSSNILIQVEAETDELIDPDIFIYYTINSTNAPIGSRGIGKYETITKKFIKLNSNSWSVSLPMTTNTTSIKYKIGASIRTELSVFPFNNEDYELIENMETRYSITNLNAETLSYYPHNDYSIQKTGLEEGYHILKTKTFLNRNNDAPIFNLSSQTFYYDIRPPDGEIIYPKDDVDSLNDSSYEFVIRTDTTVSEVLFNIIDSDNQNDDESTNADQGNGENNWANATQVEPKPFLNSNFKKEWRFDYVNIPSSGNANIKIRLKEASSSTNNLLNDAEGHYTTLEKIIPTSGPGLHFFVAYPQNDLQYIGSNYITKIHFSKSLATDINNEELLDCFTFSINSNIQARANYSINYNIDDNYHEFAFSMEDYFNELPSEYHEIEGKFVRENYPELKANRLFYAVPSEKPFINIASPSMVNTNGEPFNIIFSDIATPQWMDRKFIIEVDTTYEATGVQIDVDPLNATISSLRGNPDSSVNPGYKRWRFLWQFETNAIKSNIEGDYLITATANLPDEKTVSTIRNTKIIFREVIPQITPENYDNDNDDDGIPDINEINVTPLPDQIPVTEWINQDVHNSLIFGLTTTNSPDSDGDGLPDGLELGLRMPLDQNATSTTNDTNGDGFNNFISDLDPPFYNTFDNFNLVPAISTFSEGDKSELKAGSTTDPTNADSDFDGISDGIEDFNRNGWIDGDGEPLYPNEDPTLNRLWPDEILDFNDSWLETDPNNPDTDSDGLSDGFGEDKNFDGFIEGDANSDRIYSDDEQWLETDPLKSDTDGDSLPDGWETIYGLNPLDNGINNLSTTNVLDGNINHGADGDIDQDGKSNLLELINGTNPTKEDNISSNTTAAITIGSDEIIIFGSATNENEFTDWKDEDLIAIDDYDDLEMDSNGGDVYYLPSASDNLESSRDLIAFYAKDGGASTNGGDDTIYFRVDTLDLKAFAEDSGLNIYVVLDIGNPEIGERKIIDDIDVLTDMRWEAIVAVYDNINGSIYINKPGSDDTDNINDNINYDISNVEIRTQNHNLGFKKSYFNHKLDSIEFSIHRDSLLQTGWNGQFNQLNFQVFTTRDGTDEGAGELDGPDIHDIFRNKNITEDFAGIIKGDVERQRLEGRIALKTLSEWDSATTNNSSGIQLKVIPIIHGNQHIEPGNMIQALVNTGYGAGLFRPIDTHEAFNAPLTMHITPTLASALEWAKADDNKGPSWRDGPALNKRIRSLISTNLIKLTGSTFSDHLMPYFNLSFNADNISLASEFLSTIYGTNSISSKVLWTPERLIDHNVFSYLTDLNYEYTFIDQSQHLYQWFGIDETTGDNAHRINLINNIKCIPISDNQNQFIFQSFDDGPSLELRKSMIRRFRSGVWDNQYPQVMTFLMNWQDFTNNEKANNYDKLIKWMKNKSWIKIVTVEDIANGTIDISVPFDGNGDVWKTVDRGQNLLLKKVGHNWIQYSTQEDYDNWYFGSELNQGLNNYKFNIFSNNTTPLSYGDLTSTGIISSVWNSISQLSNPNNNLGQLARLTLHASVFETGFHNQTDANLTRFSSGEFVYPDTSYDTLAGFSLNSQAQTRKAYLFSFLDQWVQNPPNQTMITNHDIDLDGINEYQLFNDKIYVVFENIGGRINSIWLRSKESDEVFQMTGNLLSYTEQEDENEGIISVNDDGSVASFRTSCLKDWYVWDGISGTNKYVNDTYNITVKDDPLALEFSSSDSKIVKTVSLDFSQIFLNVHYKLDEDIDTIYIRNGLSPNLLKMLIYGHKYLGDLIYDGNTISLNNNYPSNPSTAAIKLGSNVVYNSFAKDDSQSNGYSYYTVNMRNQAHTQQIELIGTNEFSFSFGFGLQEEDSDNDNLPDNYELTYDFLEPHNNQDSDSDYDNDGFSNLDEYIAGTLPNDHLDYFTISSIINNNDKFHLNFSSKLNRKYHIFHKYNLTNNWIQSTSNPIIGNDSSILWIDEDLNHPQKFYKINIQYP